MSTTSAGWFADPTGRSEHRYWDGNRWTEHVSHLGIPATDPIDAFGTPIGPVAPAPTPIPIATEPGTPARSGIWAVPWWAWAIGAAVLVFAVAVAAIVIPTSEGREITTGTSFATGPSTTTTTSTTTSSTTTSTTTTTILPPTTTTTAPPPPPPPPAAAPPAVAAAPAPSSCNPNYTPCIPMTTDDVDCLGGGGDGPVYTGPVRITGTDVYGLDRDGDGSACE